MIPEAAVQALLPDDALRTGYEALDILRTAWEDGELRGRTKSNVRSWCEAPGDTKDKLGRRHVADRARRFLGGATLEDAEEVARERYRETLATVAARAALFLVAAHLRAGRVFLPLPPGPWITTLVEALSEYRCTPSWSVRDGLVVLEEQG